MRLRVKVMYVRDFRSLRVVDDGIKFRLLRSADIIHCSLPATFQSGIVMCLDFFLEAVGFQTKNVQVRLFWMTFVLALTYY